jgi:hypothetical protein
MKDVSIEYAHIYTNDHIGEEHQLSLDILGRLKRDNSSLVVLVDDYSFPDPSFDYGTFAAWLTDKGFKPDLVLRESQLIPLCDEVLNLLEVAKLKEELFQYIQARKYPCSLFIAAWYLLRLGRLSTQFFPVELQAQKIENILPESFKPFEEKGLEIIRSTKFTADADKIEYHYFKGRNI